jgi:hypothetical protein
MAILSDVPGIEVSIESKNQVLKEYGDNNEWSSRDNIKVPADRIALKYVQCESNAEFRIKIEISRLFKLTPSSNSITFWAEVDGRQIGGQSYLQIQLATGHLVDYIDVLAQRVSHTQVSTRPLKFCSIYTGTFVLLFMPCAMITFITCYLINNSGCCRFGSCQA